MEIKTVDGIMTKKMVKALSSDEDVSSYKLFRNIVDEEGYDNYFVLYAFNHLSRRGEERLCVGGKDFWLENILKFICQDEELFWSIMEYKECFVADEKNKVGYFLHIEAVNVDGTVINKINAKTLLRLNKDIYVGNNDGVLSYDGKTINENPNYISRIK